MRPIEGDAECAGGAIEGPCQALLIVHIAGDYFGAERRKFPRLGGTRIPCDGAGTKALRRLILDGAHQPATLRTGCADNGDDRGIGHAVQSTSRFMASAAISKERRRRA